MGMYGGLGLLRFPGKKEKKLKAWAALDQVDMLAYKDEPLSHLSGGPTTAGFYCPGDCRRQRAAPPR